MSKQFDVLSYIKTLIDNIDWVITTSNREIYFKYDAGAATKLTLTVGNYTTAELLTHLKTLLDTAFTITSAVTYVSNKFSIKVEAGHTIQYIDSGTTLEIGFTADSLNAFSITADTAVYVYFQYVDYLTRKNITKLGKRFPAVFLEDGDESWAEAGGSRYDVMHKVRLYLIDNINQDRLETLLEMQDVLTDLIIANNTLGGNAICMFVESIEKGEYYQGEVDFTRAGYNDNISVRIITLNIWERIA